MTITNSPGEGVASGQTEPAMGSGELGALLNGGRANAAEGMLKP